MSEVIETYDPNFRPLLKRYTFGNYVSYCATHRMKDISEPAPTTIGHKAAYWLGESVDNNSKIDVPILVVTIPKHKYMVDSTADWYVGVANNQDICALSQQIESVGSVNSVAAAVLQFAVSGPYERQDAFMLLDRICPRPLVSN